MADYRLHLLGSPLLTGPGGPVSGRATHKRRIAVLAVLALARGRPVGRERLMGLLWPEQPADSARHSLSESLYVLKKELGEGVLASTGGEVALVPEAVETDVDDFEAALEADDPERAVRAYGGPLLDGFYVSDAPEFERWAEGERDRLARAYAGALERLAGAAEAEGRVLRAVEWWRRLAAHDPFSSRVALQLVRALAAAGERPEGIRFAEQHAALLRAELEVGPDPALVEFVEHLRSEPVRTSAHPPAVPREPAVPPPAPAPDAAAPTSPPLAEPVPEAAPPAVVPEPTPEAPATAASVSPAAPAPRAFPWRWLAAAVLAVAVLGAVFALSRRGPPEPGAGRGYDPRRIAVLYFDDHSPGGELAYLANGLTEMLIHELSQVEALDVVSRNGVKPYRERAVPFDTLVADLRVGSVVEGSLQRSGDSVRVTVQLIDANTGAHLESRLVTHLLGDVFALETALAEEVSGFLRRRLGREVRLRETGAATDSEEARALVLRAAQAAEDAQRLARERDPVDVSSAAQLYRRADSLLARAEAEDPRWTRPTVDRGWVAHRLGRLSPEPRRSALLSAALDLAERALEREPGSAAALELRGATHFYGVLVASDTAGQRARLDRAERDLRAATAADSSLASAWATLSLVLRFRGRLAESDLAARRALAEDAYLAEADAILHRLFSSALMLGDYPEARSLCERGRRRFPDDWRFVECGLTLMREDTARAADPDAAWRLVAELERRDPPARARAAGRPYSPVYRQAVAAGVLARAGRADSARAVLARARRIAGDDRELRLSLAYDAAYVHLLLGERETARRLVEELLAARPSLRPFLARDPLLRELVATASGRTSPGAAGPRSPRPLG